MLVTKDDEERHRTQAIITYYLIKGNGKQQSSEKTDEKEIKNPSEICTTMQQRNKKN